MIIVGSGIGGLSLGCALADKGRHICVLEARSGMIPSRRGLSLQPNGLDALERLRLLKQAANVGARTDRVAWRETNGKVLAVLEYSILKHPYPYILTVVPSDLERALRDEFVLRGGNLHESTSFHEFLRESDGVRVRAEKKGSRVEFFAQIIVGADGQNSKIRENLHVRTVVKEYSDSYLFMLIDPVEALREEARQFLGVGKMIGLFPTRNATYVFCYIPRERLDKLKTHDLAAFKNDLVRIEPEVASALGGIKSWDDIDYATPKKIVVDTWVSDRVALIGDAAHALNPSWAQGANTALQDAVILADTIEGCFQSGDYTANSLKRYEQSRRKQTVFMQQQAERTARLTSTENPVYHWMGKRVLKRTGKSRNLMRIALQASCGLREHLSLAEQLRFLV